MYLSLLLFFFCKQKTAYEMRISDWSSDVCSSDLHLQIRLVDRTLDEQPRAVDATLPARAHRARQTAPRRLLQIGIGEHQHRRLAAKFKAAGFQGVGGTAQHFLRRCAAADELDLVDARKRSHRQIGRASCRVSVCPYL